MSFPVMAKCSKLENEVRASEMNLDPRNMKQKAFE